MKKAFTLIELLVTIVLFSLLLATSLYSFRFISLNIRNINNTNPQQAIHYDLLRNAIGSIYYYIEKDAKAEANRHFYHFFKGTESECFFISKSSFFSKRVALVHLKYDDGVLLYEEGEIFNREVNYLDLYNIPLPNKKILHKKLKKVHFSYVDKNVEKKKIDRQIPDLIKLELEDSKGIKKYIFKVKSNNTKHLRSVKFGKEIL